MDSIYCYLLGFVVLLLALFLYGTYLNGHFRRNGVKSLPAWPLVGNMLSTILRQKHVSEFLTDSCEKISDKYFGMYQFTLRMLIITDLELIKKVTVKDFDHFTDTAVIMDDEIDPLFGSVLLAMKGQKWRDMRSTLSPAFTSSKMRNMFQLVADCGEHIAEFYKMQMEKPENKSLGHIPVEMKDAFTRYTNDVIASTAFGIAVDSHTDRDNSFYVMAKETANLFSGWKLLRILMCFMAPRLSKLLGIKIIDNRLAHSLKTLVNGGIKSREDGTIYRPDLIQLLMEAKRGSLKHEQQETDVKEAGFATVEESVITGKSSHKKNWTEDELTAQAVLFLLAGFETASTLLCFMAHELAVHPDIQDRLFEEISEVASQNGGKINYADLQNMTYMDMVVSETLRYWPPVNVLDRICVKPYMMPPSSNGGKEYQINVGEGFLIPVMAIHRDAKYFPYPHKFDPERFSEENKGYIQPFTYMPFGIGPRNCIGSRLALMETKAVMFHLLLNFEFTVISETQVPLKLAKNTLGMDGEKGFRIGLKPRVHSDSIQ